MFAGIVSAVGCIARVQQQASGLRLDIDAGALGMQDVALGDSIAVNGVCLTVVQKSASGFSVDVSQETLDCSVGLTQQGAVVNLEKALRLADRIGGHLVTGHIDGVGTVVALTADGEHQRLRIEAPGALALLIARKGSIAVDGVSLTINEVDGARFGVNLIPHTLNVTTFKDLSTGRRVNLEVDIVARYVERMLASIDR